MNTRVLLVASMTLLVALAGCSDKGGGGDDQVIPGSVNQKTVEEIEARALEEHPRVVAFPGQVALPTVVDVFEGTLSQFAGAGVDWPDDNGDVKAGGEVLSFDLSDQVPENQPVEIRLKLKWWGDPGASVDMDIFVDVPGEHDAYDGTSDDESWNWNIVTKFRVVNTVHEPGQPLLVGMELQNGKIAHPDGVHYELHYELHFPGNVLAPGIPYVISVPDDATSLILESEPLGGDEHVTSDLVIYGPDDQLVQFVHHNDIATETLRVGIRGGGDYVIYSQHQHGGFLRIETDVQNPGYQARIITKEVTDEVVASGPAPAPSGRPTTGALTFTGPLLDIKGWIRPDGTGGGSQDAEFALMNDNGDYQVFVASGQIQTQDGLRAGAPTSEELNADYFAADGWTWGWRNNGQGLEGGYTAVTYSR